jgi:hypothetical protein
MSDKPTIFIGSPVYANLMNCEYVDGIVQLVHRAAKGEFNLVRPPVIGDSLVTRARNSVLHAFFHTGATHLMWIDSDIGFTADDVLSLVNSGYDFTCGAYPKKKQPQPASGADMEYIIGRSADEAVDKNGWQSVDVCGTGFMCWTRKAAERLLERARLLPYKHASFEDKFEYRVFHNDIAEDMVYLSEDYWVCLEWRRMAERIWLNPNIKLSHAGIATWKGDYSLTCK